MDLGTVHGTGGGEGGVLFSLFFWGGAGGGVRGSFFGFLAAKNGL